MCHPEHENVKGFHCSLPRQQDAVGLDVSVDDVAVVAVLQGLVDFGIGLFSQMGRCATFGAKRPDIVCQLI